MPKFTSSSILKVSFTLWVFLSTSFSYALSTKTAVLVVDMQDRFLEKVPTTIREDLKEEILDLLEWAYREEVPVVTFEYKGWGPTTPKLKDYLAKMPHVKTVIKSNDNGFYGDPGTEANKTLKSWGSQNLIISGINANFCVKGTAGGALDAGYAVWTAGTIVAQGGSEEYPHLTWWLQNKKFFGFKDLPTLFNQIPLDFLLAG